MMHHLRTILILILFTGCTSRESETTHSFRIYEENGVMIAETTGGPLYDVELFEYEHFLELIENPDEPDSYLFRPRLDYRMDSRGDIYILDNGNKRIAVFGKDGCYKRAIGREGDGPGEFRSLSLRAFDDKVITIWDSWIRRATCYLVDGTLRDVIPHPIGSHRISGIQRDGRANFYYFYSILNQDDEFQYMGAGVTIVNAEGDTISDIQSPAVLSAYKFAGRDLSGAAPIPYGGDSEVVLLSDNTILCSSGLQSELVIRDISGRVIKIIRIDLPLEPVTAGEKRLILNPQYEDTKDSSTRRDYSSINDLQESEIPTHKAYWSSLFVDDFGYIWLQLPKSYHSDELDIGARFRVLSPEGEYLGITTWSYPYGGISRGYLMGWVEREETGELIPTIYRLHPTVEELQYHPE